MNTDMEHVVEPMTPEKYVKFWARKLAERSARFQRLAELNAPEFILANERKLVFNALMRIPVAAEVLILGDEGENAARAEEHKFLMEHGFFDEGKAT